MREDTVLDQSPQTSFERIHFALIQQLPQLFQNLIVTVTQPGLECNQGFR